MAMMTSTVGEFLRAVLSSQTYKPGQGSTARNATLAGTLAGVAFVTYAWSRIYGYSLDAGAFMRYGIPVLFLVVGGWIGYRVIHYPPIADFLITTEAEMAKVSWPSWQELKASTMVVLVNCFVMAVFLFLADTFWKWILRTLGILKIGGLLGGGGMGM